MNKGLSMVEMLVVFVILGIVLSVGTMNYLRWRDISVVQNAAQQVANDIGKARSQAKRTNQDVQLSATSGSTTYTLAVSTVKLPIGVVVTSASNVSLKFEAPQGTLEGVSAVGLEVKLQNRPQIKRTVWVVGVLGKVTIK